MANAIKSLKSDPNNQILVAGIYGVPLPGDTTTPYKIDELFNQNTADTAHPTVFDYWPICYDPAHPLAGNDPTTQAGYQASIAFGATGGLRMDAFINEFPNGLKFSICQPTFADAMTQIGVAIEKNLQNLCVNAKLLDTDTTTPGLQPDCHVAYAKPDPTTGIPTELPNSAMPQCQAGTGTQPTLPCWKLVFDTTKCNGTQGAGVGQLINVVVDPTVAPVPAGTKVTMSCETCVEGSTIPQCVYSVQ